MSELSFLEKLLDGVEVLWQPLGEIATITIGEFVHKDKQSASAQYPVFNGGISNTGHYDKFNNTGDKIIVSARGANAGFVNRISKPYWAGNSCYSIGIKNSKKVNWIFVFYYLKNSENKLIGEQQKGGIPAVSKKQMEVLQIPIPCPNNPKKSLEIQAEIVRILDAFTAMAAELTAELNLRKKQYNYYRDQLLSFEEGDVEWKTLGEVSNLITKGTTPKEFVSEGINFIKLESFDNSRIKTDKFMFVRPEVHAKELKRSILEANDILFAIAGATIGKCAIVDETVLPANTNQALAIIRLGKQVNVKFVFYFMQTDAMKEYIARFNKTSAQPNLNLQQMSDFKIPVPSLTEQARIVAILDKFDALTNSITEGLPREIELRQKQYEYYRDLLLSFPKPGAEVAA